MQTYPLESRVGYSLQWFLLVPGISSPQTPRTSVISTPLHPTTLPSSSAKMPWKAQVCTFCKKRYANKTGLRTHLAWFVGEWRLPADGVHDVLQIARTLRRLSPSTVDDEDERFHYRCWTCSKVFKSRWRFQEHVIYRRHCQEVPRPVTDAPPKKRARGLRSWQLPFDEEHVLIKQRTFPSLKLPLGACFMPGLEREVRDRKC